MNVLRQREKGDEVRRLQALLCLTGFDAKPIDGDFGPGTARAVRACQRDMDMAATGEADETVQRKLGMDEPDPTKTPEPVIDDITVDLVSQMFSPLTPRRNIERYLPPILAALRHENMDDRDLVLMCLGTIRAETERFEPVDEGMSKFNTDPGAHPFNRYDNRLGNRGHGEGEKFKGRGFVQLTGRENYEKMSARLGLGSTLVDQPEKANDPEIAAHVLAAFIADKRTAVKYALFGRDLAYARRLVNGGRHGIDRFVSAFETGARRLAERPVAAPQAMVPARVRSLEILVDRFVSDDDTTISRVVVDGQFVCFGLEDEYREDKVPGETRIPAGTYGVHLRTEGGFHTRYRKRFGAMHQGMLHIQNVENFTFVLIHCGNTDDDTAGCLLVGTDAVTTPGDMSVRNSTSAYKRFYEMVVDSAARERLMIRFEDNDRGTLG